MLDPDKSDETGGNTAETDPLGGLGLLKGVLTRSHANLFNYTALHSQLRVQDRLERTAQRNENLAYAIQKERHPDLQDIEEDDMPGIVNFGVIAGTEELKQLTTRNVNVSTPAPIPPEPEPEPPPVIVVPTPPPPPVVVAPPPVIVAPPPPPPPPVIVAPPPSPPRPSPITTPLLAALTVSAIVTSLALTAIAVSGARAHIPVLYDIEAELFDSQIPDPQH